MEMTVIVEEFYYTHSLLEAGALVYHAVGAEGRGKCGQVFIVVPLEGTGKAR